MAIDPSIALQGRLPQFDDSLAKYAQFEQIKAGRQQNKLTDLMYSEKQRGIEQENALTGAYKSAFDPATGKMDNAALRAKLGGLGNYAGIQALDTQEATQAKTALESRKAAIEQKLKEFETITQIMGGVNSQESFDLAKQQVTGIIGPEAAANMPQVYDPAVIEQGRMKALTVKEQLERQWKADEAELNREKFDYQQSNDAANRAVTMRGQDKTAERAARTEQTRTEKPLPMAVVKQVKEARDMATTMENMSTSFKPEFSGKGILGIGADAQMSASGILGADKNSVAWWKDYKKQVELAERHALFGAALTPTETVSWRSADISPGMDAEVIKNNLATRAALSKKMSEYAAQDMIDAGHSDTRVNAISGRGANAAGEPAVGTVQDGYRFNGGDPANPKSWVKQ